VIGDVLKASAVIWQLAEVVPKNLFIEVTEKMERFDANVGALQSALQETPEIFESVGMHLAVHVAFRVVNHVVGIIADETFVGLQSVSEQGGHGSNILPDFPLNHILAPIRNDLSANFSASLKDSHNDSLVVWPTSHDAAMMHTRMHVASLAADECFIDFHFRAATAELHKRLGLHSQPDSMKHEPCGFLGDAKSAGHFVGTDSVLAVGNHPDSDKPLVERERRILKDSPDLCGELSLGMLALALPYPASGKETDFLAPACGAFDAVRPAPLNHEADTIVRIGEVNDGLL